MTSIEPRSGPHPVHTLHRAGAAVIGAFLMVFAVVAFAQGVPMMSIDGAPVLGLSANGLLAGVSLVVGAVLLVSAVRGGPSASTVSVVVGGLFLLSGLGNLVVLGTAMNMFAFRLPNIFFSLAVGLVLVVLGSWGRFTGGLPTGSPYHRDVEGGAPALTVEQNDSHTRSRTAIGELADAECASAGHRATPEQSRRLAEANKHRGHDERLHAWERSAGR